MLREDARTRGRQGLGVLAGLMVLVGAGAAPLAASTQDEMSTAPRSAALRQTADSTMPAMLRLALARSQAADVAAGYHLDGEGRGANPRHGLDLAFTPRGARIDGPAGGFALRLERFGRGAGRRCAGRRPASTAPGSNTTAARG